MALQEIVNRIAQHLYEEQILKTCFSNEPFETKYFSFIRKDIRRSLPKPERFRHMCRKGATKVLIIKYKELKVNQK